MSEELSGGETADELQIIIEQLKKITADNPGGNAEQFKRMTEFFMELTGAIIQSDDFTSNNIVYLCYAKLHECCAVDKEFLTVRVEAFKDALERKLKFKTSISSLSAPTVSSKTHKAAESTEPSEIRDEMLNASGVEERRDDAADANIHILRMIVAEDTGNGHSRLQQDLIKTNRRDSQQFQPSLFCCCFARHCRTSENSQE